MNKNVKVGLQIGGLFVAAGALEYSFFHAPDLTAQSAQAETPRVAPKNATVPATVAAAAPADSTAPEGASAELARPGENHLRNIRQLTFGGENAEAYWSFDGKKITFQSTREGVKADQIFTMNADGSDLRMVSSGKGRTTCSYFLKDGKRLLYASTHLGGDEPPPPPDQNAGYAWAIYPTYDIFTCNADGSKLKRLTTKDGYDAEGTVSPDGKRIVFTSTRNGDLDLYSVDIDGDNLKQLTDDLGYDGGAFYSPDGKLICYRANHPKSAEEQKVYKDLLARNLVKPNRMELWVMNADGTNKRQVTSNGFANFCPYFTPDSRRLLFASNLDDPKGRPPNFELYLINLDGTGLERVTHEKSFDGFPMFSPDGKKVVWASNRNSAKPTDTNIFVADWVP